jgi:hypothetical protein
VSGKGISSASFQVRRQFVFDNIKMDLGEIGWGAMGRIDLAQDI